MTHSNKDYRMPKIGTLDPREARVDLTSRECAKIIGAIVGGLVEMANPDNVRTAVRWWCDHDAPWEVFKSMKLSQGASEKPAPELSFTSSERQRSKWAEGTLQAHLEMLFFAYCKEYGKDYDRTTFLDFVVATLFEAGDVKILIAAYKQRLHELCIRFPAENK